MDDDDRARWTRLIVFTIALLAIVLAVIWWSGWFYAGTRSQGKA